MGRCCPGLRYVFIRPVHPQLLTIMDMIQGISMPIDQFNLLLSILPEVEAALIARGQTVHRPIYDGEQAVPTEKAGKDDAKEDVGDGPGSKRSRSEKQNFEATSEEEE